MNDGLIYKLVWMLNDETSTYKQKILQEAIDALADKTISSGEEILTVADDGAKVEFIGPQWHDYNNEDPKEDGDYLCFVASYRDGFKSFVVFEVANGKFYYGGDDAWGTILYWMPIPPLPKEDDASGKEVHLDGGDE